MKTAVMTTVERWQGEFLDLMDRVEEPVVRYTGDAAKNVAEYVPDRPDWAFLDRVPTMTDVVENQLVFTNKLVANQTQFVRKMMKAMRPTLKKLETVPTHATATPMPVAKKAPARRARTTARKAVRVA